MKTTAQHMHSKYRFAESNAAVLELREIWNGYKVVGVDHAGSPFTMPAATWEKLQIATEDDFRDYARRAEIAAGTIVEETSTEITHD